MKFNFPKLLDDHINDIELLVLLELHNMVEEPIEIDQLYLIGALSFETARNQKNKECILKVNVMNFQYILKTLSQNE